jgi:hypothetical protein
MPADFDFGFNLVPTSVDSKGTMPLQMSVLKSSLANWTTTIISLDFVDICIKNSEMFLLLCDFFSLYFQDGQYGHPGVAAYVILPPDIKPFGGADTRLFMSRPHISVFEGIYIYIYIYIYTIVSCVCEGDR